MLRNSLLIAGLLVIVGALSFSVWHSQGKATPPYMHGTVLNIPDAIAYWKDSIAKDTPAEAYKKMTAQGNLLPAEDRHTLSHTFGEALFDVGGISYMPYCGSGDFLYGCYHQFIGMSTAEHGVNVISTLRDECEKSQKFSGGCMHGIGHGLVSTYGYNFKGLTKSLADCHLLFSTTGKRDICADGVFMEFNLQEITTLDENRIARPLDAENPYEPCLTIGTEFKNACIYEQPLWWYSAFATANKTPLQRYTELGNLCRALPGTDQLRHICFTGIGFPAAQVGKFNVPTITANCTAAASSSNERLDCLAGAVRRYVENGVPYNTTCGDLGLSGKDKSYCEKYISISRQEEYYFMPN